MDVPTRQILDSKGSIPTKTYANAKIAIKEMDKNTLKNGTMEQQEPKVLKLLTDWPLSRLNSTVSGKETKKVNEKVYAAQVGCELCKGPHYTKDCPLKEEEKTLEEAYYTQFGAPYQTGGQYRAAGPGFYQRNNENSSYPDRRQTMEESLTKFMAESTKRHEENLNIIKEIQASTDAAIRNQGALIKTLEIQIGHMSKVLQERGFISLSSSTETNPRDHVKSILTAKADSTGIRRIRSGLYAILDLQISNVFSKTISFCRRLHDYCCNEWKEACELKILETYSIGTILHDNTLPKKEKDPRSFTLPLEAVNKSFDPHYGDYIELNDLDVPLEPRMNQDDNFEPTIDENVILNEPASKHCYKIKFSCMIEYKHVIADFLPTLSINTMTKRFYNSIIKDEGDHEGKKLVGTLIDIPIFVWNFSIISGFSIIDDMDVISGLVLGMPFCKKFVSCQKIMEKFARRDKCERLKEE
ncbi:retrovirus-related pol polyprotein from transposon TNT 1-94 [Tanacetum coccineum]